MYMSSMQHTYIICTFKIGFSCLVFQIASTIFCMNWSAGACPYCKFNQPWAWKKLGYDITSPVMARMASERAIMPLTSLLFSKKPNLFETFMSPRQSNVKKWTHEAMSTFEVSVLVRLLICSVNRRVQASIRGSSPNAADLVYKAPIVFFKNECQSTSWAANKFGSGPPSKVAIVCL